MTVTVRERELLRDETFADPEYAERFRESGGKCVARFTASELDDILGHVAAAANHTRRAKLREELDALYDRLEPLGGQPRAWVMRSNERLERVGFAGRG